jgi:hypothetical protein
MNQTPPRPAEAATRPLRVAAAIDRLRIEAVEDMADLAASLWRSAAEAAWRGDRILLCRHCSEISAVTREAFAVVKTISATADQDGGA